uniref:Phospholipid/glycerol acyltransferase domain-containing protein n=1 Tax=Clastoptera arizonana TaxID=38151 RepID=A0A1B6CG76_9HEMI
MVETICKRTIESFHDILKDRLNSSDFMYVTRQIEFHTAYNRHKPLTNPVKLKYEVLNSPIIQELIQNMSVEQNISKKKATYIVKSCLEEIGYLKKLPVVRWIALALIKIIKKSLSGLYVNENKLIQIRNKMGNNPVIFVPSHRSYADFILMALVMFNVDITIPCVAAGMDFHSMWMMGHLLRDCGAFFMRRSFSDDTVYRTIFSEYVKKLVTEGDSPIEFFIEGTRSRSSKTLPPKFGLLSMALDAFYSGEVPDITLVPVNISYERTLEESLFAYEMLGIAKPKESTSGLIKGLKMMDEKYGKIYFDFGDPISIKSFGSQLIGSPVDFTVRNSSREQEEIVHLGYNIIDRQQKLSVLTCFNVLALVLGNHINVSTSPLTLTQAIKDVAWLSTVLDVLGAFVDIKKDTLASLLDAIRVHRSLVKLTSQDEIQLVSVHSPLSKIDPARLKGHPLKAETMNLAIPLLMLQQYINHTLHFLVNPAIITVTMQHLGDTGQITTEELFTKYQFMRTLLSNEFAFFKEWDFKDFEVTLQNLESLNIIEYTGKNILTLGNHKKLQILLCNMLYPFISTYLCFGKLLLESDLGEFNERVVLKLAQAKVEEELTKGNLLNYTSLSLDIISAALFSLVSMQGVTRIRTLDPFFGRFLHQREYQRDKQTRQTAQY